jgi:hypothetical protein
MSMPENATAQLLEPMTAREYLSRFAPGTRGLLSEPDSALQEGEQRAAAIAAPYGFKPSAGRYPRVIWDLIYS